MELGNLVEDAKGKMLKRKTQGRSTDASIRDGPLRSSDEAAVMAVERCAVESRCFSVGDNPTREPGSFHPVTTEAAAEVTKPLEPSV